MTTFTQKTTKGVFWTGTSSFLITILNFVILAILARLLSPSDFGMMGIIIVVIGFATMISDMGIGVAVIQRQDIITKEQLSTFFFLNVFIGIILLCGIGYLFSGIIASFFKNSDLVNLLRVTAVSFIIISLGQTFRTLLQKSMNFKALAKVEISGIIIYGISSITFALIGFGVWSLVFGFLIRQVAETVLLWIVTGFRPQFVFNLKQIKGLITFGMYVFGERIVNYLGSRVDYIIIGRFLGSEALGYYSLAYQLIIFPLQKISPVIGKVAFPAFSTIQGDNEKLRPGYLKGIKYVSLVAFPILAGLFSIAPEFIYVIYGEKWAPAILILQILCSVGMLKSIGTLVGTIYYSKGRADIGFKWNLFVLFAIVPAVLIGVKWGINGVVISILILSIPFFVISQYLVNRLIDLRFVDFFKNLKVVTVSAFLLIVIVFGWKFLIGTVLSINNAPAILLSSIILGMAAYITFVLIQEKSIFLEIKSLIFSGVKGG